MQRFLSIVATVLSVTILADAGRAQPADISIVSVLTIAKDEAEKARNEVQRMRLRARVAGAMRRTGQHRAFGNYASEALAAYRRVQPKPKDEIDTHNLRIEQEANAAFLAGDTGAAERLLAECKFKVPLPNCAVRDFPVDRAVFLNIIFLKWEVEAERFDAALARLRETIWPQDILQLTLLELGPDVADGEPARMNEINGLLRKSGVTISSCVAEPSSLALLSDLAPDHRGAEARLRMLACDGQKELALQKARAERWISRRVSALTIVAEGLAGVPGTPDE